MKKNTMLFMLVLAVLMGNAMAAVSEWSDIPYIEGRYSRIYFDWVVDGDTGTFHVINDWMVNQDDGGISGGLLNNEYNRFNFSLGGSDYEIRIFADGTHSISGGTLSNFKSAVGWAASPNLELVDHTIWEFSFEVQGTTTIIKQFIGCDPPAAQTVVISNPPNPPFPLIGGPSQYEHYVDGQFADMLLAPVWAPIPLRDYQDPVRDPWFDELDDGQGWTIHCKEGGGTETYIPEPATLLMMTVGTIIVRCRRRLS